MTKKELISNYSNEEIINRYLENYMTSEQSVKMRASSLNYFFQKKYFGFSERDHMSNINKSTLLDYFKYLKPLDLTLTTKRNKWTILTSFLNFCMEYYDDFLIKIPSKTIDWGTNHKESNSNKNIIATEEEIKRILDYAQLYNYKMYLIYRLFVETGMRKGELMNIEYPNIDMELRCIKTKGKRGRKIYFFSQDYAQHLKAYLKERKEINANDKYLFLNNRHEQYSTREFNLFLKRKILKSVGITKDITCHTFRRTINTLRKTKLNCPVEDRKSLLGHKTTDTNIANYTILDYQQQLTLYDKYYPYQF